MWMGNAAIKNNTRHVGDNIDAGEQRSECGSLGHAQVTLGDG